MGRAETVSIGSDYELRFDGELLDVWYKDKKNIYRCDPRMVRYSFTRARVFGGEYLSFTGQAQGDTWMTRVKPDDLEAVRGFIKRVFDGGDPVAAAQASPVGEGETVTVFGQPGEAVTGELRLSTDPAAIEEMKARLRKMVAEGPGALGAAAGQPQGPGSDELDRLSKLADLHDRGALTDEEFAAEKAKILGES